MKKIIVIMSIVFMGIIPNNAQVTTYFYGRNKIQSDGETAALYSVKIYDTYTTVTVELIPTRYRARMNYWTSPNTWIIIDNDTKLPIIGFLKKEDGEEYIDTRPFSGDWGWNNVKKDEKYYYTMVFKGKIPPGVKYFTLKDDGTYSGAHGYGWSNYQLDNPHVLGTQMTESSIRNESLMHNDGICGIYEGSDNLGYKLGCIIEDGDYFLIYIDSKEHKSWWKEGDVKAMLRPSATEGVFKADWIMRDKSLNSNCYVFFDGASMKTVIDGDETFYLKMFPTTTSGDYRYTPDEWSGTGFALNNGYIATNYHVIEDAKSIKVRGINGNFKVEYNAFVVATDKYNDLAIIKVKDNKFNGFGTIPYRVKTSTSEVGEEVFVLGYPLTTTMGEELKLTTGVISSKSGFQGDVSLYQISAPIQPGNSGGPLFDENGNVIGVVNAKHRGAENVSYAIKTSYLKDLAESTSITAMLPSSNSISGMSLSNKVKGIKNFVFIIDCSSTANPNIGYSDFSSPNSNTIKHPFVYSSSSESTIIEGVTMTNDYTAIDIKHTNYYREGGWCSIDKSTYIIANGKRYTMTRAEGIKISPNRTTFSHWGQVLTFTLYFPKIPSTTTSIDLIENNESEWKWYGIKIK